MQDLTIEAQSIPTLTRHEFILKKFDTLESEQSLIIINNHSPTSLLNDFFKLREGLFKFSYLEEGPTNWQLKITKLKKEGCCGFCS